MTRKPFPHVPRESRKIYLWTISLTFLLTLVLQLRASRELGLFLNKQVFYPLVFSIKSKLKTEHLDPRIKIFAFDDSTVAYRKSTDISLSEWADLIIGISNKENVTVLVDKLFDAHPPAEEAQTFSTKMASISSRNIGAIVFAHTDRIRFREEIDRDVIGRLQSKLFKPNSTETLVTPQGFNNMNLYGAQPDIIKSFGTFGIANYLDDGLVVPFVQLKSGGYVPHAALSIFGQLDAADGRLRVLDKTLPTNHQGKVLVNFFDPAVYRKAAFSMVPVIARTKLGQDISVVNPGDIVVILPAMFTGHTDFVDSPFGLIPGGFHIVALIQSVLRNDWITIVDDPGFFMLVTYFIGIFIGLYLTPRNSIAGIAFATILFGFSSTALFVYANLAISFVLPSTSLVIGGLCGLALNIHTSALEEARKNRELEVAALVQKSFFPPNETMTSIISSCRSIGKSESASECGGDWWGSIRKNRYTYFFIADAVGHGVPAALLTSIAYTVSRALELEIGRAVETLLPSDILNTLNRVLISVGSTLRQMTFFVVRIHDETGECVYANAGNSPAFWIRKSKTGINGRTEVRPVQLTATGNVLGDFLDSNYENHSTVLENGDKIFMYTDGMYENRTSDESSQLGKPWLRATIQRHAGRPLTDFTDEIWRAYKMAIGTTPPDDDASIFVIEFDNKYLKSTSS